ncbi:hypothetical protein LCGC14_1739940 [marine sediment metagenome]|uniref:Uncharacterized protein n=1 Tax=marine sediment metagenome TaxID=412755 RepID=A0A0F9H6Y4_9ZZZZ
MNSELIKMIVKAILVPMVNGITGFIYIVFLALFGLFCLVGVLYLVEVCLLTGGKILAIIVITIIIIAVLSVISFIKSWDFWWQ